MESLTARRASMPAALNPQPTSSLLIELHKRYEQTIAEYLVVELAENGADDEIEKAQLRRACQDSCRETESLRTAVLYQVPSNLSEAAIVQFHVTCAFDMMVNCEDYPEAERQALTTAIDTLFDFLCCEMKGDHEQVGASFSYGAIRAHDNRRHRTGLVEA